MSLADIVIIGILLALLTCVIYGIRKEKQKSVCAYCPHAKDCEKVKSKQADNVSK